MIFLIFFSFFKLDIFVIYLFNELRTSNIEDCEWGSNLFYLKEEKSF